MEPPRRPRELAATAADDDARVVDARVAVSGRRLQGCGRTADRVEVTAEVRTTRRGRPLPRYDERAWTFFI